MDLRLDSGGASPGSPGVQSRAAGTPAHRAVERRAHRYGASSSQVADLWLPADADRPLPVVVLLHGGYWRGPYTKALMNGLARDLARRGLAAWNVEYRRTGLLGRGGGWPATFDDVAAAVEHLRHLDEVDSGAVVLCGHSAGGHLALWAAARHRLPPGAPGSAPGAAGAPVAAALVPRGVVSLAGVADLAGAAAGGGRKAVRALLGPDPSGERLRLASPMSHLPLGVPQVLVHGAADDVVPASACRRYARAAVAAGDDVVVETVAGVGHRGVLDARSPAWSVALGHVVRMLHGAGHQSPRGPAGEDGAGPVP